MGGGNGRQLYLVYLVPRQGSLVVEVVLITYVGTMVFLGKLSIDSRHGHGSNGRSE